MEKQEEDTGMQIGELLRRAAFISLDRLQGGRLERLKEVNKREILEGIRPSYEKRRLAAIIDHAREHSPYYQKMEGLERLEDFPVMNKSHYVEKREEILCPRWGEGGEKTFRLSTSGSTGSPFTVLCDREKMDRIKMNFLSVMELNGFRLGMKRGEFRVWIPGKNTISAGRSFKNNLKMIDISNMGEEALGAICHRIKKERIQVLVSYSSALTALSQYIRKHRIDVGRWHVEMIFSMGEALPQATFELLREEFGINPVRSYGNNENGFIAIGLGNQEEYKVDLYNYYIEILKMDSDEPAKEGELGRIVVTDYYSRAFPMIRYDTGDTGIVRKAEDKRGRRHLWFREIYGRRGSLLYNTKGEPLSIHVFMNVLLHQEGVLHQAKCIQWEKDRYELILNVDRAAFKEEELLLLYKSYLGQDARIDISYVEEIPVQASGKRMVCENGCPDYN